MRLFKLFMAISLLFCLNGCENKSLQDLELAMLQEMYLRIESMADAQFCDGSQSFGFTPIGDKACGGPMTYIAYNLNINVDEFLETVADYTALLAAYNQRGYFIFSDCSVPSRPSAVSCENNRPVFVY